MYVLNFPTYLCNSFNSIPTQSQTKFYQHDMLNNYLYILRYSNLYYSLLYQLLTMQQNYSSGWARNARNMWSFWISRINLYIVTSNWALIHIPQRIIIYNNIISFVLYIRRWQLKKGSILCSLCLKICLII
jgi:hypothetical protein